MCVNFVIAADFGVSGEEKYKEKEKYINFINLSNV